MVKIMTRTYLSVSEKIDPKYHRSLYILHNGWEWYHADTNTKEDMMELLKFFECEILEVEKENNLGEAGKVTIYNLSKDIISKCGGGFWNLEQMMEQANGRRLKSFIGLSNGSLTTCYAAFDDENNTVEILRPNPNAKEVYPIMPLKAELEYRKNHWFL